MSADGPRFTIVSAVYNVADYLPDFIDSIAKQTFDLGRVEVIMVDDGSTDESRRLLDDWATRQPGLVRVIGQQNAGQGAARNAGVAAATGEWVTFPDPDDIVDPDYLETVDAFLLAHPETSLVATKRVLWSEVTGKTTNTHPLERFFTYDRLVDLEQAETHFHGSAPAAFFSLDRIRRHDLRFDSRIRPNFEDGHFTSLYLLHQEPALVGFLGSTRYHYRKRADQSSSLQGSMLDPGRYTAVFEHGYLAILDRARELRGTIPGWLQHFACYELLSYLSAYDSGRAPVVSDPEITEQFHGHVAAVLAQLDLEQVVPRLEFPVPLHRLLALQHGYADRPWRQDQLYLDAHDPRQELARVHYYFTGAPPTEVVVNGEVDRGPRHAKTRDLTYFGRTLLRERILWVRYAPDLRISVDGRWGSLRFERPVVETVRALPRQVRRFAGMPSRAERDRVERLNPEPTSAATRKARKAAATDRARKQYADAWVLMDRIHDAGDSGEILFRRLRSHHPEINAWFTIEEGTADWHRLRKEFGKRVVAHGTVEWRTLMAHCAFLLSSHADEAIMEPVAQDEVAERTWQFVFLQHGVIKDDLSTWLGRKEIDLFVTSSRQEYASIAGDGTRYPFTTKEVQLTGLPRFDRLREVGDRFPASRRDLVLVTPTWRRWLVDPLDEGSQRRQLDDDVLESEFVLRWLELLRSDELADACRRHGLILALLPHPNLAALLPRLDLPAHVQALGYQGTDVQELFARARVLVTDYSSIAFNAAYIDRPVVYHQFDADLVLSGGHVGRGGYFDYHRDGFGPVAGTTADAVAATVAAIDAGPDPAPPYDARIRQTFPDRDGLCSERVIAAVLASTRPDQGDGQVPTPASVSVEPTR
jgi:glycosyltransferase involved in cell wall biosynthesis